MPYQNLGDAAKAVHACLVVQSYLTLGNSNDCSSPGSSVHSLQARTLEWVAILLSWPRNRIWVSCITGRFFTIWATREALQKQYFSQSDQSLSRVHLFATSWTRQAARQASCPSPTPRACSDSCCMLLAQSST